MAQKYADSIICGCKGNAEFIPSKDKYVCLICMTEYPKEKGLIQGNEKEEAKMRGICKEGGKRSRR